MCVGIPMQVVEAAERLSWCEGRGQRLRLDLALVGEQPPGAWVLAFQGSAVRVLTPEEAAQTNAALDALEAALDGNTDLDAFFADLTEREPQLPAHLKRDFP
ncbi:MAG TPA: HypC/HybG/HupF family hydrogenase formation chaperone [Casimicrobiaceae bacterium]|nr:HypC/HybG/HupF family hydrogenase formation chaperone [Casimicrobiaceae bacterium]